MNSLKLLHTEIDGAEYYLHNDIKPENVHFPDGTVARDKVNDYCRKYEQMVDGRIDLMIMGVGELGQIGFNEPGSYAHSTTRLVQLSYNTRKNQDKFFSNPNEASQHEAYLANLGNAERYPGHNVCNTCPSILVLSYIIYKH